MLVFENNVVTAQCIKVHKGPESETIAKRNGMAFLKVLVWFKSITTADCWVCNDLQFGLLIW